jgi:hypothetical protein
MKRDLRSYNLNRPRRTKPSCALGNVCWHPECPADCLGRATSWNSDRIELLLASGSSVGAPVDDVDRFPEVRDWLLASRLIVRSGQRYIATWTGKRLLGPPLRVL